MAETDQYQWTDNPTESGVALCDTDVLNDCLMHLKYDRGGNGYEVGDIVWRNLPSKDAGKHLLDGTLIQGSGMYSAFVDYIAELYTENPNANYFTNETSWQASVTQYGVCGKFVYDSTLNTVRLPKITGIIEGTIDVNALGDLVEAGLPNITGSFNKYSVFSASASGAFTVNDAIIGNPASGDNGHYGTVFFDASRSSSIYGNSTTVQPQTVKCFVYIVIATSTKTNIQVDIDEIVTDLNGKCDTDLSNISASQSAKDEIIGWSIPDYPSKILIGSAGSWTSYTAPSDGYFVLAGSASSNFVNATISDFVTTAIGLSNVACFIPILKNTVITRDSSQGSNSAYFIPLKGVN